MGLAPNLEARLTHFLDQAGSRDDAEREAVRQHFAAQILSGRLNSFSYGMVEDQLHITRARGTSPKQTTWSEATIQDALRRRRQFYDTDDDTEVERRYKAQVAAWKAAHARDR